jgi:heme-degrading monooxygenase HmoA
MADQISLDVIDRPEGGTIRALRDIGHRNGNGPVDGLRGVIRLRTMRFVDSPLKNPQTPRRIAVLSVWRGDADVEAGWQELLRSRCTSCREHWHVRGEVTRASFTAPWRGWEPCVDDARPHSDDEPALIVIAGDLRLGGLPGFMRDGYGAVSHASGHPGYLGGLVLASSPLNTTSCSAWRSYADAKDYAFAEGRHRDAMLRDRREERHVTEHFFRVRPLETRGTLNGRRVFAV